MKITREKAIEIHNSGIWKSWSSEEIVRFQLYQECLSVPWEVFHGAVEEVLEFPVYTHEFAHPEFLKKSFESRYGNRNLGEVPNDK